MDVCLNFINESNDTNNSEIVIFQKNIAYEYDSNPIAWHVFQNIGRWDHHPFTFPYQLTIAASDSYGNYSPQLDAEDGDAFAIESDTTGSVLVANGSGIDPRQIEFRNALARGAATANIFRAGKLLACSTSVVPRQRTIFRFEPKIWIGVVSQIEEGQVMSSAITSDINTELSVLGVASADIVMTGGGSGPAATPFEFELKNVVMA